MTLYFSNTLTRQKEPFTPLDASNVRMYVCGPTVYDRAHIGNARAVVVFDILFRLLRHTYGENHVTYARNITDVDDKINKAAHDRGITIKEVTTETTRMFHEDMASLNCLPPSIEPKATEHIGEMIAMIQQLIDNGHAYAAKGHVLFSVASDPNYGHLARRSRKEMVAGARVEIAPYKRDAGDFVLWKPSSDTEPGWESPWGYGRPGWHIECSAMSTKYLGTTFDIHGGGADLQFPHHENEVAQSCCANKDSEFAKYWLHNGFLTVGGEKMSKSLGNFTTVHELLDGKHIKGEVIRYILLATHYKKPLDYNEKGLEDATKAMNRFYQVIADNPPTDTTIPEAFITALSDDLNTPKAFSLLHAYAQDGDSNALYNCGKLLGLFQAAAKDWLDKKSLDNNTVEEIESLIEQRKEAKATKNWAKADEIRDKLNEMGVILEDKPNGLVEWKQK